MSTATSSTYSLFNTIVERSQHLPYVFHRQLCGQSNLNCHGRHRPMSICSVDAAQSFDYEHKLSSSHSSSSKTTASSRKLEKLFSSSDASFDLKLKIAIVGFGNFGQFLARTFIQQGHSVIAYSRTDHTSVATSLNVKFFSDPHDLCEEHPDVVILCTSILSTEAVIKSFPLHRLRRNTLFVDVLSVKEFPRNLFIQTLPREFDVLCTHPMFGPESGKDGWGGLPFVYDKVRIGDVESRINRCNRFLEIFEKEGCKMVEMSCMEHDKHAASSQFMTHTLGRVLSRLNLPITPIGTKGYETLLSLVENTRKDSFDLYYGLFMYNKNSTDLLVNFEEAFDEVKKELFEKLHDVVRKQLFESIPEDNKIGS